MKMKVSIRMAPAKKSCYKEEKEKKRKKKNVLKIRKKEVKKKLLIRLQIVNKFEIGLNMRKHSLDGQ